MGADLESEILKEINKKIVKSFVDVLILEQLRGCTMSGYDVIEFTNRKFNVLLSSDSVYAVLHSMERDGLIEGIQVQRKWVYDLTDKGEETLNAILNLKEKILGLMINLFI